MKFMGLMRALFACVTIAPALLSAVQLVSPEDGAEFCALQPLHREFLSLGREGRRARFLDRDWRHRIVQDGVRSDPLPLKLVWKDAEGSCEVRVERDGRTAFSTNVVGTSVEVWNLEIAREYEWSVRDAKGTAHGRFRTRDQAPRLIRLKGIPNVRDLGGRIGLDGRRVRQGLVYRSAGLNDNANAWLNAQETMALYEAGRLEEKYGEIGRKVKEQIERDRGEFRFDPKAPFMWKSIPRPDPSRGASRLDAASSEYARKTLGWKSDIDLRWDLECWGMTGSPLGPEVTWFHIPSVAYAKLETGQGKAAFAKVFRLFLDRRNYPIDFHCIGGADRAGSVAFILNALLGVSDEELDKDWEMSCFTYERQDFGHVARYDRLRAVIDAYPGRTTCEKAEQYVRALGFTDEDLRTFREIMLEADPVRPLPKSLSESEGCLRRWAEPVRTLSPDGRNEIRLWTGPLSCEVLRDGVSVLAKTEIGLKVDGSFLSASADPRISTERRTGRVATPVYKKSEVDLTGNETLVDFGDWAVRLAARDDGVAYRFEMKREGGIVVDAERADVTVQDKEAVCRVYSTDRVGCEEAVPERLPWREARERIRDKIVYLPFVYETAGKTVAVTESDVRDYPIWNLGSKFARAPKSTRHTRNAKADFTRHIPVGTGGRWVDVVESEDFLVRTAGRRTFPWRVFIVVDEPCRLCESDAVFALAEPADAKDDFSWVRPGKVAWDWWNAFDNQGEKGCNTATYLRFIDFAASNGVEYVILDEGWSVELDIWRNSAAVDLPKIIGYARERGVGIILWLAWAQAYGDEERVAGHFAKLGAKGFKVDFMDRGDAAVSLFLERFAAACARHRMLVDYHGAYRPTGLQRKYLNIVNYEGVHGLENLKWYAGRDMTTNELCAFFCRMTAGPLDFTPGAMDNYAVGAYPRAADTGGGAAAMTLEASLAFCNSPGSIGTRTRQMAMLVAYEAPLQMLCDSPTKYGRNRECFAFMSATPTVWDETVGLGGNPDDYAAIARRSGESWYVAAMANADGADIALNTRFLGNGDWMMESFRDAEDADVAPSHYIHSRTTLRAGEPIGLRLAPGGGFVARLVRK